MAKNRSSSGRSKRPAQQIRRNRKLSAAQAAIAAAVIGAVATIIAAALGVFDKPAAPQSAPTASPATIATATLSPSQGTEASGNGLGLSGPRIAGDDSSFVADITYPDGATVSEGQHFSKQWEIKNTGTVLWANRYLVADGTRTGLCTYPSRVRIPLTRPGQDAIISVPVTAPDSLGVCFVTWKMETSAGTLYFPNEVGIWFNINVTA